MKLRKITMIILLTIILVVVGGCQAEKSYDGVRVVFELEGGVYQNCERPATYYYDFEDRETILIKQPTEITGQPVTRANYHLEGWYQTKTINGDEVTYSDKWDFTTDRITKEGIRLYARWLPNIVYSYDVCYYEEKELKVLGTYEVGAGDPFDDYMGYANLR